MTKREKAQALKKLAKMYKNAKENQKVFKTFKGSKLSFSTISKLVKASENKQDVFISDLAWNRVLETVA